VDHCALEDCPAGRQGAGSVFAGVELFIWGGYTYNGSVYTYLNSGARFRPVTNTWTTMGTGDDPPDSHALGVRQIGHR